MPRLWGSSALLLGSPFISTTTWDSGQALVVDPPEHINRKLCSVCSNVTRTMLPGVGCWGQVGKSQRWRRDITVVLGLSYSVPADHDRDEESELEADKSGYVSIAHGCLSSCSKQSRELAAVQEKSTSIQEDKQAVGRMDAQERHVQSQKQQLSNRLGLYSGQLAAHL